VIRAAGLALMLGMATAAQAAEAPLLVNLALLEPAPLQEIRYATRYNFTGQPLYPWAAAFLHRDAAAALARVQASLSDQGLGLKVFDAYRPLSVQKLMWERLPDERYVSNPNTTRGRHTRGTAVDLTLIDHLGQQLGMPSDYDDFSERAHRDSKTMTPIQRTHLEILDRAMRAQGFEPLATEWWHYDYHGWQDYPVLELEFQQLSPR